MPRRVKVVEDNPDIAEMLTLMLDHAGIACHSHLEDFDALLQDEPWQDVQVAVVDLMLGRSHSGADVLRWLADNRPGIRRIAMTASLVHAQEATGLADAVLVKPFHSDELVRAIHRD